MSEPRLKLGDFIRIDGINMRVDEIRITHSGISYHMWWLAHGDIHDAVFTENELFAIREKK